MTVRAERPEQLTPRERAELEWEKEATQLQAQLFEKEKDNQLQIKRLEVKWTQLFRLPQAIILLPVKLILAFAIPIAAISKQTLPKEFWEFLRG